ncbi:myb-related transcription factor, partner of profilin-like [Mastacembelus armatus]|uniref:myb-related transcription factor, partner of profilin-like n=1 Tax=Mastacembelus armatus TaxID=205130 RepID=UPI001436CB40|nr:myb-related transcription factor, partner of profilin-like [Mastacembelus armatus]
MCLSSFTVDYEKDRKKAKKAETTAHLSSDSESMMGRFHPLRRPNSRYQEYQQSTDEEDIRTPHRPSPPIPPTPQAPPALLDPPMSPTQTNPPSPPASSSAPTLSARPVISSTERHIISQLEHLKEQVSVIKQLLMTLTDRNSTAAISPEGKHLPLSSLGHIQVVQGLKSRLLQGCGTLDFFKKHTL